jgi:hypothetical protein
LSASDGCPVRNQSGEEVGRLVDLVARVHGDDYPAITGMVVRVGRRHAYLDASVHRPHRPALGHAEDRTDGPARVPAPRGRGAAGGDILDHQLVDTDEVQG